MARVRAVFQWGRFVVYQSKQSVEAEARRAQELEAGLVSERFPAVKRIRLQVEFHDATGARVQRRCRELLPEAYAILEMKCPLDSAPLELRPVVSRMITDRVKNREGEVKCTGSRPDSAHSTTYQIQIDYQKSR